MSLLLDFLSELHKTGLGYSGINTARSAISMLTNTDDGTTLGAHPLVIRFMKGIFKMKPTQPRYHKIWDVSIVLNFLRTLSPVRDISLKDLTLKTVALTSLLTASRCQTLHELDLDHVNIGKSSYSFYVNDVKQSRPGYKPPIIKLSAYPVDRRLCIATTMNEYIRRTDGLRTSSKLFISYTKPFKQVSKETISRWIKIVLIRSGIDVSIYKPHSTRSAAVSKASVKNLSIDFILSTAGWSNCSTFAKYYEKPIVGLEENHFAEAVLS